MIKPEIVAVVEQYIRGSLLDANMRLIGDPTDTQYATVLSFLLEYKLGIRLYALNVSGDTSALWDTLRSDEGKLDFVFGGFSHLNFYCSEELETLRNTLVKSYLFSNVAMMDSETRSRLPTAEDLNSFLKGNEFYVFILLIPFINWKNVYLAKGDLNGLPFQKTTG